MGLILKTWLRFNQNRHVRKVTGSRITAFYGALSIIYAAIQVIFLAATWQVNHGAGRQLEILVERSGNGLNEFSYLDYSSGSPQLRLCTGGISHANAGDNCPVIWPISDAASQASLALTIPLYNATLDVLPYDGLTIDGEQANSTVDLDANCVQAIKWPYHHLLLLRREDVSAACFHSWLLFMSVTALLTESIPHIGTSFILHVFALGWSAFQLWATQKFEKDYSFIIAGPDGACAGIDLISGYFRDRTTYQIATTVVNFVSAIASGFLCWRLFGTYGWATFKKMGASRTISRAYKCALALSICIQLEVFFYIASVGCFLDEIIKRLLGADPQQRVLFIVGYSLTSACVIPWLYLAWYGIRRESKRMMSGFFILSILYLGISGATFSSNTFRRTFEYWILIATAFSISWALLIATIALAIVCTLNFGKGLPHYFERRNGEDSDDYSDDFHPSPGEKNVDLEIVSFPSAGSDDAVIIAFPSGSPVVPVIQRSGSASSYMSQESHGSIRLPPLQMASDREMLNVVIPPPPNAVLGRNITASGQLQAASNSSFSPSWSPGDDRAMMTNQTSVRRFPTASSFGNINSTQMYSSLGRDFSFGTQASSNIIVSGTEASSNIILPNTPQRSISKSSVSTTSSTYSYGRKRRIDLGEEL